MSDRESQAPEYQAAEYQVPLLLAEPEVPFWGFGEIFVVIAVFLVSIGVLSGLAVSLAGAATAKLGYWSVAVEAVAYAIMLAAMKVIFFWRQQPLFRSLAWIRTAIKPGSLIGIGFGLFVVSVLLQLVLRTPEVSTPFEKMLMSDTASRIARVRGAPEGREGVAAFLEKRPPAWMPAAVKKA